MEEDSSQYFDYERFKPTYNIDKVSHPDSEVIKFCGRELTLGEIRDTYSKFEETKYGMISFFDDVYQYTSLGLLDMLYDMLKVDEPMDLKSFFKRKEVYGIDWVFNKVSKYGLTKDEIETFLMKRYDEVLDRSPVAKNINGLFKLREIMDRQILVFKYQFNGQDAFISYIKSKYGHSEYTSLEVAYSHRKTELEFYKSLPASKYTYFNVVACNDAQSLLDFIIEKDIKDTCILTSLYHSGIPNEDIVTYKDLFDGIGPQNSRINYMKEGV